MQLSSELFERIVGVAAPAQPAPTAGDVVSPAGSRIMDRRAVTRIPFGARAKITFENPEQVGVTDTVMLQDISVQGVSFVSAEWIALEEILVVYLKDQQNQELRLRCKVQRCEQGGYGGVSYIIGTTFLELLENSDGNSATAAVAPTSKKSASRKRRPAAPPAGLSGKLKKLNPLRLFGSRNFDDFTAVGEGSKPSRELLDQQEAEAAGKSAEAWEANPIQSPSVETPVASDPGKPRKSSIFLRSEPKAQEPDSETAAPQTQKEPELQEQQQEVAAAAPPVEVQEPVAEATESSSISADDIAAILGAIPMDTSPASERLTSAPPIPVRTAPTVADPPPPPVAVISEPVAAKLAEAPPAVPVKVESVEIKQPVPLPPVAVMPEPVVVKLPEAPPAMPVKVESDEIKQLTPPPVAVTLEPVVIKLPEAPPAAPVKVESVEIKQPVPPPPVAVIPEPVVVKLPEPPPVAPARVEVVEIKPSAPLPAAVIAEPEAIQSPPPPVSAPVISEPVAAKLPEIPVTAPVRVEPAEIKLPTPSPIAEVKPEPVVIKSPPLAAPVNPEPVAINSPPPPPQAMPTEYPTLSAAEITAIMNAIPVAKSPVSNQSSSELPATVSQPAPMNSEPAVPQTAPTERTSLSAAEITAIMNAIPVPKAPVSNQSSSELPTPTPVPQPAPVISEPVAIELSIPAPVVVVEAEPVAIESPAPVIPEPVAITPPPSPQLAVVVSPEPVATELPEQPKPELVAAVAPEPVQVESPTPPQPVEVVAAKPEKIELPAVSSAPAKEVVVEAEQAEVLAEEVVVAEEVENAVKPVAPNQGTVKLQFTEKSLPSYLANPDAIEDLVPWLSFKGVGAGDLPAAIAQLGFDGTEATAMNVLQMKETWTEEYRAWSKRDLRGKRYIYMWADGFDIGGGQSGLLVVMGAGEKGERELIAVGAGQRENPDSWIALLADMKNRGLTRPPKLFIGDTKLGLWKPLTTLSPTTRQQRCWTHKSADVLRSLPKTLHLYATAKLDEIAMAARREAATKPLELFTQICGAESPEAAQCLLADKETLLTFHDFPAEHWTHLRNTSAIGGIFDTLDLKTYSAEGAFAGEQAIIMAFKLAQMAQRHWRKLSASPLLSDLLRGATFIDGVKAAA